MHKDSDSRHCITNCMTRIFFPSLVRSTRGTQLEPLGKDFFVGCCGYWVYWFVGGKGGTIIQASRSCCMWEDSDILMLVMASSRVGNKSSRKQKLGRDMVQEERLSNNSA